MEPWIAKAIVIAASVAMIVIRAPHGQRSHKVKVVKHGKGTQETILLTLAWIGFFIPLIWVVSPLFSFADYPLHPAPLVAGGICILVGLWLLYRSHADLGTNWSITLEVREAHRLIEHGVYRRIRHPMYLAFLLYGLGQALVVPNWVAGPVYPLAMAILVAMRMPAEERLMLDKFGEAYSAYMARTRRIVPGIW